MGYLVYIFMAFGAQALAEEQRPEPLLPLAGALVLLPLARLLAAASRHSAIQGRFRLAERLNRLVGLSGPLGYAALLFLWGWQAHVEAWTGSPPTLVRPGPGLLLSLAPYVLLQALAIDAQARAQAAGPDELRRARAFQLRMLASSLAPVGVYLALSFLVGLDEGVRVHVERVALLNAVFLAVLLLTLALLLPRLLAATWETARLPDGPERMLLAAVARRAGFRAREHYVWRTGHSMANAAIVGLFPSTRIVLFSDSLLSLLGPRELAAVYGHEIGHAARRHVTIFLCWALAFFLGGDLLAGWLAPDDVWTGTAIVVAAVALWLPVFGWLSRRFELEADLFSLELLGDPGGLIGALERLGGRLRDVAGWRHFSTSDRVRFLERAWSEPGFASRFRGRLRALSRLGMVLAFLALAGQAWSLLGRLGEDRVYAELALGRYGEAAERARELGLEEDLVQVARLGADLADGQAVVPVQAVERALGEAMASLTERGSAHAALALAQLLVLREVPGALALARELEPLVESLTEPRAEEGPEPDRAALSALRRRFLTGELPVGAAAAPVQ